MVPHGKGGVGGGVGKRERAEREREREGEGVKSKEQKSERAREERKTKNRPEKKNKAKKNSPFFSPSPSKTFLHPNNNNNSQGDQGFLDEEGYVTLTGRLKELINRGGEKISPIEVDGALLSHPAVAEAVSFGAPDEKYGEVVAAAVVLVPGAQKEGVEASIREHASKSLAAFKVGLFCSFFFPFVFFSFPFFRFSSLRLRFLL